MESTKDYGPRSLNALIHKAVTDNWDRMALTDMGGMNYQYKDVALWIEKLHIIFEEAGVGKGDKVAICGRNSSNWAVVFLSSMSSRRTPSIIS